MTTRRTILVPALAAALALLWAGSAFAADIKKEEAETFALNSANASAVPDTANTPSGGSAVRFHANGAMTKNTVALPYGGTGITVYGHINGDQTSRVCARPRVGSNALDSAPKCWAPSTQGTGYSSRYFAGDVPAGSNLSVVSSEIEGAERLFVDYIVVNGPPDADGDGVPEPPDNCPATANASQADLTATTPATPATPT